MSTLSTFCMFHFVSECVCVCVCDCMLACVCVCLCARVSVSMLHIFICGAWIIDKIKTQMAPERAPKAAIRSRQWLTNIHTHTNTTYTHTYSRTYTNNNEQKESNINFGFTVNQNTHTHTNTSSLCCPGHRTLSVWRTVVACSALGGNCVGNGNAAAPKCFPLPTCLSLENVSLHSRGGQAGWQAGGQAAAAN